MTRTIQKSLRLFPFEVQSIEKLEEDLEQALSLKINGTSRAIVLAIAILRLLLLRHPKLFISLAKIAVKDSSFIRDAKQFSISTASNCGRPAKQKN